jgi:hypothetical protein
MVAKSSHILVHIVLGRLGLMGKVLMLWNNGEEHHFITTIRTLILKVLQVFFILLIRVIRLIYCKECKNSSVRGMFIPYDVLFWMVG